MYIDFLIIIITYPYSTCISSFWAAASLLLCSFLKCVFVLIKYNTPTLVGPYIIKKLLIHMVGTHSLAYPEIIGNSGSSQVLKLWVRPSVQNVLLY